MPPSRLARGTALSRETQKNQSKVIQANRFIIHTMKPFALLPAIVALLVLTGCATSTLTTVDSVDLKRYSGKWYEIARIPNTFQRDCTGTVTAEYTPLPNGKIQVINSCQKSDNTWKSVKGTATPVAGSNNTKLKVNFGIPFHHRRLPDHRPRPKIIPMGSREPPSRTNYTLDSSPEPKNIPRLAVQSNRPTRAGEGV